MRIGTMRLLKVCAVLAAVTSVAIVAPVAARADSGANLEVILRPARLHEVVAQPSAFVTETFEQLPPLNSLLPRHVLICADPEAESPHRSTLLATLSKASAA